jgi:hypothetical protein
MSVDELANIVERAGGVLQLQGENVRCWLPKAASHLAEQLREHKPELISLLHRCGGRLATFPHCPRCASYALYRHDSAYECLTCGLSEIAEETARRLI